MKLTPIAHALYEAGYGGSFATAPLVKYPRPVVYDPAKNAEACAAQLARDNAMAAAIKRHNHAVRYRNRKILAAQKAAAAEMLEMDAETAASVKELEEQYKVMGG